MMNTSKFPRFTLLYTMLALFFFLPEFSAQAGCCGQKLMPQAGCRGQKLMPQAGSCGQKLMPRAWQRMKAKQVKMQIRNRKKKAVFVKKAENILRDIHLVQLDLLRGTNTLSAQETQKLQNYIRTGIRKLHRFTKIKVPYTDKMETPFEYLDFVRKRDFSGKYKHLSDEALLQHIHQQQLDDLYSMNGNIRSNNCNNRNSSPADKSSYSHCDTDKYAKKAERGVFKRGLDRKERGCSFSRGLDRRERGFSFSRGLDRRERGFSFSRGLDRRDNLIY